jgi:hypothetical protein
MSTPPMTRPWVTTLATALVLLVVLSAFALSFTVLRDLAALSGIPAEVSWLWPVIADGTIAAATLVLYASRGRGRHDRALPTCTLALFALVSVVGNVVHILLVGDGHAVPWPLKVFVGVVPPLGLLLTVELLVSLLRSGEAEPTPSSTPATDAVAPEATGLDDSVVEVARAAAEPVVTAPAQTAPAPTMSHADVARATADTTNGTGLGTVADRVDPADTSTSFEAFHDLDGPEITGDDSDDGPVATDGSDDDSDDADEPDQGDATRLDDRTNDSGAGHDSGTVTPGATNDISDDTDDTAVVEDPVPPRQLHLVTAVPSDPAAQVDWIVSRARDGHDVSKEGLAQALEAAGQAMSTRTLQRRLAAAREQDPAAFVA